MPVRTPGYREILRYSAASYFTWLGELMRQGERFADPFTLANERFPHLTTDDLAEAAALSADAQRAARILSRVQPTYSVQDSNVPVDPTIPDRYRYETLVVFRTQTGVDGRGRPVWVREYRSVVLDSSRRLSRTEVETYAQNEAIQYFRPGGSPSVVEGSTPDEVESVRILSVTRRG